MPEQDGEPDAYRDVVARALRAIPEHSERPATIGELARCLGDDLDHRPTQDLVALVGAVLAVVEAFGVVTCAGDAYRSRGPMPTYFLRSLAWYVEHRRSMVDNWLRGGVRDDISVGSLLEAGPHLLRLMEDKRLRLAGQDASPTREQRVAFVLVKALIGGRPHFLFEWDRLAAQYQLIGGGIEAGEEPEIAAQQELIDEIDVAREQRMELDRDFEIQPLVWEVPPPILWTGISRTVGALTRYEVWVYSARIKLSPLRLRDLNRWLTIEEMLSGETRAGRRTGDPALHRMINARLKGGLESVPLSTEGAAGHLQTDAERGPGYRMQVFIGHGRSQAWRALADHLRDHHGYRVVTFESAPRTGFAISDVLAEMAARTSFAILIHTAEDEQADGGRRARQNVVHETGLFQGILGFRRAIVIRERGCEDFSNLLGIQELLYETEIKEVFGDIVAVLRREFDAS